MVINSNGVGHYREIVNRLEVSFTYLHLDKINNPMNSMRKYRYLEPYRY